MVELLVQYKADRSLRNANGLTPLDEANRLPHGDERDEMIKTLKKRFYSFLLPKFNN